MFYPNHVLRKGLLQVPSGDEGLRSEKKDSVEKTSINATITISEGFE